MSGSYTKKDVLEKAADSTHHSAIYKEDRAPTERPLGGGRRTMHLAKTAVASLPVYDPDRILISTMSTEYIDSVCQITISDTNESPSASGGVNSASMGTTDGSMQCSTCHQLYCTGHPGKIILPFPVINRQFFRTIAMVLFVAVATVIALSEHDSSQVAVIGSSLVSSA